MRNQDTFYADRWCRTPGTLDHTCIQNAINAAATSPRTTHTVYVPAGTYTATASISLASNVSIVCSKGWKTQINFVDDRTAEMRKFVAGTHSPGIGTGISNFQIEGCSIKMIGVSDRTGVYGLISVFNSSNFHIRKNQLGAPLGNDTSTASSSACVFVSNSSNFELAENTCDGTQADGFHISRGSNHFSIHDNWFKYNGDDSIALIAVTTDDGKHMYDNVSDASVLRNHVGYNGGSTGHLSPKTSGISCMGCARTEIADNQISDTASGCIHVGADISGKIGSGTRHPFENKIHDNSCAREHRLH